MDISIIAAIGRNNELGRNNDLIWHFKEDMKFFKEQTTGSTVIMGRKTFESLPKALPNRRNIVISSNSEYAAEGAEVVTSLESALESAKGEKIFIIGGGRVYSEALPYADKLILTEINDTCEDADTFFPQFDKAGYERRILAEYIIDNIEFKHIEYKKILDN